MVDAVIAVVVAVAFDDVGAVPFDVVPVVLGADVLPVLVPIVDDVFVILDAVVVLAVTDTFLAVTWTVVVEEQSGSTLEVNEPSTFPAG